MSVVTRGSYFVRVGAIRLQLRGTDHRIVLAARQHEPSLSSSHEAIKRGAGDLKCPRVLRETPTLCRLSNTMTEPFVCRRDARVET